MSSREGPKANVVLSCKGCRYEQRPEPARALWGCVHPDGDPSHTWAYGVSTPLWCPLRPGKLVAIPVSSLVPGAPFSDMLIDNARALGQEVTDEKPR